MYGDEAPRPTLSATTISVWIVEDNDDYRETVKSILDAQEDIECTGLFSNCEDMLEALNEQPEPEIVLMDIRLPGGMSGIKGMLHLRKRSAGIKTVMLTVSDDNEHIFDAICAGAKGYLLKNAPVSSILKAVREVPVGGSIMSPKIARRTLDLFAKNHQSVHQNYNLTPREKEVLDLLKRGKTKRYIADQMSRSVSTVDTHVRNIYEKMEVSSRAELIRKTYGLGGD